LPECWDRARRHAERADAIETGESGYNLACIAAEMDDRENVARWLEHAAAYGKIQPLSHILGDVSFERFRHEAWFRKLLDGIFDAGLAPSPQTASTN